MWKKRIKRGAGEPTELHVAYNRLFLRPALFAGLQD